MTPEEMADKLWELSLRQTRALQSLLAPVRAAVNALKDANLKSTASSLEEVLFDHDAAQQEASDLVASDPIVAVAAMEIWMRRGPNA